MFLLDGQLNFTEEEERVMRGLFQHPGIPMLEEAFELGSEAAKEALQGFTAHETSEFEIGRQIGMLQAEAKCFERGVDDIRADLGIDEASQVPIEQDEADTEAYRRELPKRQPVGSTSE